MLLGLSHDLQTRQQCLGRARAACSLADVPKQHTSTVALVPPEEVWPPLQARRLQLRDKGLFRWPPHINLLYPFVPPGHYAAAIEAMSAACASCSPFDLTLDSLGCFGGRSRGVLYCHPSSARELELLCELQAALQAAVPHCDGQQRRGIFTPHATLTHFPSREAAEEAREALAKSWQPISFSSTEAVHILRRDGDGGQFERAWTLPLGGTLPPTHYDPPLRFAAMPAVEEDWVRQARKDAYRPGMRGRGNRRRRPRRSPEERKAIEARTPEEIAAIRAERAAKRERLQPDADAAGAAQSSLGEI